MSRTLRIAIACAALNCAAQAMAQIKVTGKVDDFGGIQYTWKNTVNAASFKVVLALNNNRSRDLATVKPRSDGNTGYFFSRPGADQTITVIVTGLDRNNKPLGEGQFSIKTPVVTEAAKKNAQAIDGLNVERTAKYREDANGTKCNIFLDDATEKISGLWGVNVKVWAEPDTNHQNWRRANQIFDALNGGELGAQKVTAEEAQLAANRGDLVIVAWKNPIPEISGHVAIVRANAADFDANKGPLIAQAGKENFSSGSVNKGFGAKTVTYFRIVVRP